MKLTFEIKPLSLAEARELATDILADVVAGRRLDRLDVANLCAHVKEPRRKGGNLTDIDRVAQPLVDAINAASEDEAGA